MRMDAGSVLERDVDAELQQRRKQQSESMTAAIERARQRREDDERRIKDEQSIGRVKHQSTDDRVRIIHVAFTVISYNLPGDKIC